MEEVTSSSSAKKRSLEDDPIEIVEAKKLKPNEQ